MSRFSQKLLWIVVAIGATSLLTSAQYKQTNLVSTSSASTAHQDANLINGWGLTSFPTSPFWVSDNVTGVSTLYDQTGTPVPLVVTIPPSAASPASRGLPTGIVANATPKFVVSANGKSGSALFLFASLDGAISGWNPNVNPTQAVIAIDNSASGAVYTGLAIAHTLAGSNFIYAADAAHNQIDIYNGSFKLVRSFHDPATPKGLSVYGVHNINGQIFVTLATPVPGQGGAIDVFTTNGQMVRRLTTNGPGGALEGPWGIVLAPNNFGPLRGALLVGNVDDGHISAFVPKTGRLISQMRDPNNKKISIPGLWGLKFGSGAPINGATNSLFFSAGPSNYTQGLFGVIKP